MEHICPKCKTIMTEAVVDHSDSILIYKKVVKKPGCSGMVKFNEMSNVNQCVCPECGYIEFYSDKPRNFK